ncbi:RagB/SusD family nutrient uptake outer membrane protein [Galbibacter mesophilus]|uniref:RagB/SusD family nutrient uptake outer membrane protein n=1 Tax=Galbibacter mesophilus TaxID=379069 RepID=UPI00293D28C1|nr:RagB/SusD family nutrient uptake outer membrane protein [Galbibacter mesophilus]
MKSNIILSALASTLMLASCGDDFLESEPTEFTSQDQIDDATEINPEVPEGTVRGLYALMSTKGTGGTDLDHDDFGQKGWDIYSDILSGDMVLAGLTYGWYSQVPQLQTTIDFTNPDNAKPWRYYYRIIYQANKIVLSLGGNETTPESVSDKHNMGQAKAMRIYAYFYLANLYAEGYNPTEEILPIYTEAEDQNQPLSTTKEVYDLIIKDLMEATVLLEGFSGTKSEINKWIAKDLLAYAYAAQGEYSQVKSLTQEIINSGAYPIMTAEEVIGGFNTVATPCWMWGTDITLDNNLDLVSWWGQVDLFTYSYAWAGDPKSIDDNLYSYIKEGEIRKRSICRCLW